MDDKENLCSKVICVILAVVLVIYGIIACYQVYLQKDLSNEVNIAVDNVTDSVHESYDKFDDDLKEVFAPVVDMTDNMLIDAKELFEIAIGSIVGVLITILCWFPDKVLEIIKSELEYREELKTRNVKFFLYFIDIGLIVWNYFI